MTNNSLDLLRSLDPVAGADPAEQVTPGTRAELLRTITAEAPPTALKSARSVRRRLVPVLAAAAAVAAITTLVVRVPGDNDSPPQALSFSTQGQVMKVRVVDPLADTERFNKEFKEHGLDIKLKLEPASPSVVGLDTASVGSADANPARVTTTMHPAGCEEQGTRPCVPEFTIPLNFRGSLQLYIGRAAEPGEQYATGGAIDGRGEALAGVKYVNKTVGEVLKTLQQRGFTAEYRVMAGSESQARDKVPAGWYVHDGSAMSDQRVILFVGPAKR